MSVREVQILGRACQDASRCTTPNPLLCTTKLLCHVKSIQFQFLFLLQVCANSLEIDLELLRKLSALNFDDPSEP